MPSNVPVNSLGLSITKLQIVPDSSLMNGPFKLEIVYPPPLNTPSNVSIPKEVIELGTVIFLVNLKCPLLPFIKAKSLMSSMRVMFVSIPSPSVSIVEVTPLIIVVKSFEIISSLTIESLTFAFATTTLFLISSKEKLPVNLLTNIPKPNIINNEANILLFFILFILLFRS